MSHSAHPGPTPLPLPHDPLIGHIMSGLLQTDSACCAAKCHLHQHVKARGAVVRVTVLILVPPRLLSNGAAFDRLSGLVHQNSTFWGLEKGSSLPSRNESEALGDRQQHVDVAWLRVCYRWSQPHACAQHSPPQCLGYKVEQSSRAFSINPHV